MSDEARPREEEPWRPDTPVGFWEWIRRTRLELGIPEELKPPRDFDAWHRRAREKHEVGDLCSAYTLWLKDPWAATKDFATAVFVGDRVWPNKVRGVG